MPPYNAVICIIYERIQLIIVLMIAHEFFQLLAGLVVSFWIPSTVDFIFLCAGQQSALTISLSFSLSCSYLSTIWGLRLASFFIIACIYFCRCVSVHAMVSVWMSERQLMRGFSPSTMRVLELGAHILQDSPHSNMDIQNTSSLWPCHRSKIILLVPFKWHLLQAADSHVCADPYSAQNSVRLSEALQSSSVSSLACQLQLLWSL